MWARRVKVLCHCLFLTKPSEPEDHSYFVEGLAKVTQNEQEPKPY